MFLGVCPSEGFDPMRPLCDIGYAVDRHGVAEAMGCRVGEDMQFAFQTGDLVNMRLDCDQHTLAMAVGTRDTRQVRRRPHPGYDDLWW
ncbi:hypothetical protein PAPYR_9524 [Paratrimastix pyriformis]|uniref:Uncharacterized protein n=1 Tax=Paratrimastix pyriformis TaxID=342808 RepID=A0ABQ8U9R2_9EUKA|nr:hypothetical protein PAPYR_9524 [Paratrimastix pyriformis]